MTTLRSHNIEKRDPSLEFRWEAYPENIVYKDTGCKFHPACLDCPLPECAYEHPLPKGRKPRMMAG